MTPLVESLEKIDSWSYSTTQLEIGCGRRWAEIYIGGQRTAQTPQMAFGDKVHQIREAYFLGEPMPLSAPDEFTRRAAKCAVQGLDILPRPPLPREYVEAKDKFTVPAGALGTLRFTARQDLLLPPGTWADAATIVDHKTCSSFDYLPVVSGTPGKGGILYEKIQFGIYGKHAILKFKAPVVRALWHYLRSDGSGHRPVEDTFLAKVAEETFETKVLPRARTIHKLRLAQMPIVEYPKDETHCFDFNKPCPFMGTCKPNLFKQGRGPDMSDGNFDAMLAMMGGEPPAPPPPSTGVTFSPAFLAQPAAPPPPAAAPGPVVDPIAAMVPVAVAPGQINPPEAVLPPTEEAPKRGKGRAKVAAGSAALPTAPAMIGGAVVTPEAVPLPFATPSDSPIVFLMIDKVGVGASFEKDVVPEAQRRQATVTGLPDYRLVKFGEGAPVFASACADIIRELAPKILTMQSGTTEFYAAGATVISLSDTVLR